MSEDPLFALVPKARRRFAKTDPKLHAVLKAHPPKPRPEEREDAFESLVGAIVHQQVSLAAGRTIYARLVAACGGRLAPDALLRLGPEGMRAAGLSRPKVAYATDLATRVATGALDLDALREAGDEEVIEALTAIKGIGTWTAKMHLIFHMRRPDVHAPEDLGLQIAVANLYRVPRTKAVAKMARMREAWSPYNSIAALTLWDWRRLMMERGLPAKD